ncbi:MAG TPA: division/cell wall cluster transcriptional repressor MraZ, partial [Actinomycetota bacterium]
PQRLRDAVGINKEVVVLGVRERIEIWDRAEFERYRDAHADAYENGDLEPRGPRPVVGSHSGFDRAPRTTEG